MKTFKVYNSQTGNELGCDPFEANSLEDAQAIVLEGEGMKVAEVEETDPEVKKVIRLVIYVTDGNPPITDSYEVMFKSDNEYEEFKKIFKDRDMNESFTFREKHYEEIEEFLQKEGKIIPSPDIECEVYPDGDFKFQD